MSQAADDPDRWAEWLLRRRDGDDERQRAVTLSRLTGVRDRVLAGAEPLDGAVLLDVGSGDGLIGLAALDRVGAAGRVIFSDVSAALLDHCRAAVELRGDQDRARFVQTSAEHLAGIADASVDVVTTRSVLIYVADKPRAFAAFRRVLRRDGRLSLFEPINRLTYPEPQDRLWGFDVAPVQDLAARVKHSFEAMTDDDAAAMLDFDDLDLLRLAEQAGFERIHSERHLDLEPGSLTQAISLDALLGSAPSPLAPTLGECIDDALSPIEAERLVAVLADGLGRGSARRRSAVAYLSASAHRRDRS